MSEVTERRQVLDMLVEGQIGPADAERLLARLAEPASAEAGDGQPSRRRSGARSGERRSSGSQLHVFARSEDGDEIDVVIPVRLLSTGVELSSLLPELATDAIEATGIQISELDNLRGEMLVEAILDLELDVDSHDGSCVSLHWE